MTEKECVIYKGKFLMLCQRMGDFGKILDVTKFRSEGDDLYAVKPQPDRYLCFFKKEKKIIVTNAYLKKGDKLPKSEKLIAINNRNDYLHRFPNDKEEE